MKNPIELQELVQRKQSQLWAQYKAIYNCGVEPRIEFVSKKSSWIGKAFMWYGMNQYNLGYFCFLKWEQIEETIAHELAHHIVHRCFPQSKQAHGPEFRMVMQSLGYSGDTKAKGVHRNTKAQAEVVNLYLVDL